MLSEHGCLSTIALLTSAGLGWFPSVDAQPAMVKAWQAILADLDDDQLHAAALGYSRAHDSKWWPTPGQLLAHVPGQAATEIDDADEAWGLVMREVSRVGHWGSPSWPLDRAAAFGAGIAAMGGWEAFCTGSSGDMVGQRASFRAAYRSVLKRRELGRQDSNVLRIVGGRDLLLPMEDEDPRKAELWTRRPDRVPAFLDDEAEE